MVKLQVFQDSHTPPDFSSGGQKRLRKRRRRKVQGRRKRKIVQRGGKHNGTALGDFLSFSVKTPS
jgi:hypothetical protein